jgi:hypothetical protein
MDVGRLHRVAGLHLRRLRAGATGVVASLTRRPRFTIRARPGPATAPPWRRRRGRTPRLEAPGP